MEAAATVHHLPIAFDGDLTPENFRRLLDQVRELQAQLEAQQHELSKARTRRAADDLEDELAGAQQTIKLQNRKLGNLERKITEEADPLSHPKGAEIVALIERWMRATDHRKSKVSDDRVKLIKARLRDGYTLDQLELAVDGIGAYRYVCNGQRTRTGTDSQRHDRIGIALAGGEKVEEFARLGYRARKAGWTPEGGWPA